MRPFSDHEASHTTGASANGAFRPLHPIVPTATGQEPPDRLADLATCMVDLLEELGQVPSRVPSPSSGDRGEWVAAGMGR